MLLRRFQLAARLGHPRRPFHAPFKPSTHIPRLLLPRAFSVGRPGARSLVTTARAWAARVKASTGASRARGGFFRRVLLSQEATATSASGGGGSAGFFGRLRQHFNDNPGHLKVVCNVGYTFMVSGLLLTDILGVRSLLLCGQGIVACFNFFQPKPLWFPVGWNLVFMCINSFQIARILNERRAIELNEEENALYLMGFSQAGMQPMLFRTLLAAGEWADVKAGERLTTIGEPNEHIYLFAKGRASVNVRGRSVATCRRGDFIGEMAFLNAEDRQAASATVVATMPSRVFRWNHTKLRELFQDSREIGEQTTRVLTDDLVQKMSKTHDLAAVHHYVQLMSVALAGDSVSVHTKDALREYMAQHQICAMLRNRVLTNLGWTDEEFDKGHRKEVRKALGSIDDLENYVHCTIDHDKYPHKVHSTFAELDRDGDGELTKEELRYAGFSDDAIKKIMSKVDQDGDGVISLEEFQKAMSVIAQED